VVQQEVAVGKQIESQEAKRRRKGIFGGGGSTGGGGGMGAPSFVPRPSFGNQRQHSSLGLGGDVMPMAFQSKSLSSLGLSNAFSNSGTGHVKSSYQV